MKKNWGFVALHFKMLTYIIPEFSFIFLARKHFLAFLINRQ